MEFIAVIAAFLFVALLVRLAKPSKSKKEGDHCFSIKNVRYTMMDSEI